MTTPALGWGTGALLVLALTAGCSTPPVDTKMPSPVTGIAAMGERLLSCTDNALHDGLVDSRIADDPVPVGFRTFGLAAQGSPGGFAVICGGTPAQSGEVAVYRVARAGTPLRRASATLADDVLYDVAITPDGETGALACADGRVLVVELPRLVGERQQHKHTAPCRAVCFSPDGARLASAGLDGNLFVSALAAPAQVKTLQDHTAGIECLAFSADSTLLASGALDGRIRLHDAEGHLIRTYQRLGAPVTALTYDADLECFYAGLRNGVVVRLDPDRARTDEIGRFEQPVFSLLAHRGLVVGLRGRCATLFDF